MNHLEDLQRRYFLVIALVLLLPGCASKIPSSIPLPQNDVPLVLEQLQKFQNRECRKSLDADVTMKWTIYGKTEKIPGVLQLQSPTFFRYAVVDPLGRQMVILVSDGNKFTLVDNRKAKALKGEVGKKFWQEFIPGSIKPGDYMAWISGRLPETFQVDDIRRDAEAGDTVWLLTRWNDSSRHHVLFNTKTNQVERHIVEDEWKDILLDVTYLNYKESGVECKLPYQLHMEGDEIKGVLDLQFDEIYPEADIPEKIFSLSLPEHFVVQTVE